MRIPLLLTGIIVCFIININASAQRKVVLPSDRRHKSSKSESFNYFIRGEFGAAYGKNSIGSFDVEGYIIPVDLYAGIGVIKNTFIHGLFGANVFTDSYETLGRDGIYKNSSICIYDFGAGLTIYAIPEWIYLSGSVTGSKTVRYYRDNISDSYGSQTGVGLELKLGTTVMIKRFIGIGLSAFVYTSMMNDAEADNENTRKIRNNVFGLSLNGIIGKL